MKLHNTPAIAVTALTTLLLVAAATIPSAGAIHFYQGSGSGCQEAQPGHLGEGGTGDRTVDVLHNTFNDASNGSPITTISAGDSVTWRWASVHCHSVSGTGWDSGFYWPSGASTDVHAVPGFFDYPLPDDSPSLSYTRTFTEPGIHLYSCVHHAIIGMQGAVIVSE